MNEIENLIKDKKERVFNIEQKIKELRNKVREMTNKTEEIKIDIVKNLVKKEKNLKRIGKIYVLEIRYNDYEMIEPVMDFGIGFENRTGIKEELIIDMETIRELKEKVGELVKNDDLIVIIFKQLDEENLPFRVYYGLSRFDDISINRKFMEDTIINFNL